MPELPEVETIRTVIEPQIQGQQITKLAVRHPQVIAYPEMELFHDGVVGQTITHISRRGKFLSIHFETKDVLTLHLRMTGCLLVTSLDYPLEKHTHLVFSLGDQKELRYIDPRRFGRFWFLRRNEKDEITGIHKLGIEPFDQNVTVEYVQERFIKRNRSIKECLLDQTVLTGIGNIYADEILFSTGICPMKKSQALSKEEWQRLATEIPQVLRYYIEKNSITPEEYLQGKGKDYQNTPFLRVYGHHDEPCVICGTMLKRVVIASRGTVYCPSCQKESGG